ncbi:MAG: LysR family transcriptional regulator [Burkholderiaceae bacterium]
MQKSDDLAAWRLFFRIAELKGVGRTAQEYHLDPSAISRHLSALERSLGAELVQRSPHGLRLTSAGERAYAEIRPLIERIEQTKQELAGTDEDLSGSLRIACPPTIGVDLFSPWLAEFQSNNPKVKIELVTVSRSVDLAAEAIDLAFRWTPIDDDRYIATRLGACARVMVASRDYLAAHGRPEHPRDLLHHRGVVYTRRDTIRPLSAAREGEHVALQFGTTFSSNNGACLTAAVMSGAGIEVGASHYRCIDDLASGRLVQLLPDWKVPDIELYSLRVPSRHPSRLTRAVFDWLRAQWQQAPGLLP